MRFPDGNTLVMEKEDRVAAHQTGHNSGVIHSGIYYRPGSYRARNCVDGRHQLVSFSEENGVKYEMCGKVIVAANEEEMIRSEEHTSELQSRGHLVCRLLLEKKKTTQ